MKMSCYSDSRRNQLLNKIRELEFAAVDLNLYLDNHHNNKQAVYDYNCITDNLVKMKKMYEMEFGPLTNFGYDKSRFPWAWIDEPWPWEID